MKKTKALIGGVGLVFGLLLMALRSDSARSAIPQLGESAHPEDRYHGSLRRDEFRIRLVSDPLVIIAPPGLNHATSPS